MGQPSTWAELVETFPLTLREKLTGTKAKVFDTTNYLADAPAGSYVGVDAPGLSLTTDERSALLTALAPWFYERFTLTTGRRYRGVVFTNVDELAQHLADLEPRLLGIVPDWPEPQTVELMGYAR